MSVYLRPRVTGATVFFTVCLAWPGSDLLVREIALLRACVRQTKAERPFDIEAWVVLPDHMHAIWRLPAGDRDYGRRWGSIKARFTMGVKAKGAPLGRPGLGPACEDLSGLPVVRSGRYAGLKPGLRQGKREAAIWQRRFWEHHIRGEADFAAHLQHCWMSPVRLGLVDRAEDWPFSSARRDARFGATLSGAAPAQGGLPRPFCMGRPG
jgi:putative transposase